MTWLDPVRARLTANRRGVLSIALGSAGAQVLALAAAPLLSRLYSPEDFGVFTVIAALVTTIGTVAALRFELAVPLPERERDAYGLVVLGMAAAFGTAVLGAVVVLSSGDVVATLFGQPALQSWLWLVPPAAAGTSAVLVLNQLAVRHRRYASIGRRTLLQSLASTLTQIGAGIAGMRSGGLALGLGVGQVAGVFALLHTAGLRGTEAQAGRRGQQLVAVARRYCRFPLLAAPSGLLNVLGLQLPILLIAYWYGGAVAGHLGLTQRVIAVPAALVASAVAQVYLAEIARAVRNADPHGRAIFIRVSRKLALVAAPSALVLLVGAPWIFSVLFGEQWGSSGVYAQALAVYTAAQIVASPLSQTLVVFERQGLQLIWDAARFLLVTGVVSGVALSGASAVTAVWSLGIAGTLAYAASWLLSLRAVTLGSERTTRTSPALDLGLVPVRSTR
ncbi:MULTISPECIES: lipopolysaccharide biosynthesis protein [unclassified Micromonospora]|uniref:lipopolysaccharide biosynthesis protein n=1 Tax=unclassified Micromonospora TaxID=2617518 RepID=UPI002FEFBA86